MQNELPLKVHSSPSRVAVLVEDDEDFRVLASRALQHVGLDVIEASSARTAGAVLSQYHGVVELMMIGGILPDCTGVEFIQTLRDSGMNAPIVYVSAFGRNDTALRNRLYGPLKVSQVAYKPVGAIPLVNAIKAALGEALSKPPQRLSNAPSGLNDLRETYESRLRMQVSLLLQALNRMVGPNASKKIAREALTLANRMHGTAGTFGYPTLSVVAGQIEQTLERVVNGPSFEKTVAWRQLAQDLELVAAGLNLHKKEGKSRVTRACSRAIY